MYPTPSEHRDFVPDAPRWNPETGDECLVEKELHFSWGSLRRRLVISMPLYIRKALRTHDWDAVYLQVNTEGRRVLASAEATGLEADKALQVLARFARERIYAAFRKHQEQAGNRSWIVPASLQPEFFVERFGA